MTDPREALRRQLGDVLASYRQEFADAAAALLRADLNQLLLEAPRTPDGAVAVAAARPAEAATAPPAADDFPAIIGRCSRMLEILALIRKIAPTNTTVLIHGESGTGKELFARAIHDLSKRSKGPYVAENCAALPETLLESELFGHTRGAFTGADRNRKGRFATADGGTLFLDEVGDMSPGLQKKLLRVLQEGELRPVGATTTIKVDVRVLSASNKDLAQLMEAGLFREDLYYRLSPIRIDLPPLRERRADIPQLLLHFAALAAVQCHREPPVFTPAALAALTSYAWPGNVRELQNEIQRAIALADPGRAIDCEDLSPEVGGR